jgi:Na+-transporting methylmalonyl-CoA/oxaloacetate decarboxylase gamma subunit
VNWINAWWRQVSATVADGLQITALGMALVFLTLGLIIIALVLLTRIPGLSKKPSKEQDVTTNSPPQEQVTSVGTGSIPAQSLPAQDVELAQVAAIAVALLQSRRTRQASPRSKTESGRWKQYGRAHQLGL